MNYYYDLILNLDSTYFYDWDLEDNLLEVKKMPVFKINEKSLIELLKYDGTINSEILKKIKGKTSIKENGKIKTIMYGAIFTDSKSCIALIFNNDGSINKRSYLMLEDELNVIELGHSMKKEKIYISNKNKLDMHNSFFHHEKNMKKIIQKELETSYNNDHIKLMYYYLEWFKEDCLNIEKAYDRLKNELKKDYIPSLEDIYNLVLLATK